MTLYAGLDLGTHLGFAVGPFSAGEVMSGRKSFPIDRIHPGERFAKYAEWVNGMLYMHKPAKVFVEKVDFVVTSDDGKPFVKQAHLYGAWYSILQCACARTDPVTEVVDVPVQQIKRYAKKGNASKDEMLVFAQQEWPDNDVSSHDEADALWVWALGRHWERFPELKPATALRKRRNSREWERKVQRQLEIKP